MMEREAQGTVAGVPRVIAVVGPGRGLGRSTVAHNLAVALARGGRRVCLFDASGGARIAQLAAVPTLTDVVAGRVRIDDALVADADGIDRLTLGTAGGRSLAELSEAALLAHVDALEGRYDAILVDAPGGTQPRALFFAGAATDVLMVVKPDAETLRQAEPFVRQLALRASRHELLVLTNACPAPADAAAAASHLAALGQRPPHVRLCSLGWIPADGAFTSAGRPGRALVGSVPDAPAARAFASVADRLALLTPARPTGGAQFFFQRLLAQGRAA